jgi:RNA polymerase sigma-70 factor (ECF subfamily)
MPPPGERGERWFSGLYAAHYAHVVRYALRRLADPDASAELAQEVFVVAWRRRAEVPDHDLPWLYGVARRLLATLSEADQEILRLVGWEELAVAEAAVVLGCSGTTAAVRLHRAPGSNRRPRRGLNRRPNQRPDCGSDRAELARRLGVDRVAQDGAASVLFEVRDVYTFYAVAPRTRAGILRPPTRSRAPP